MIERCRFDLRWKVALDLELYSTKAPFVKSTFQAFRVRLTVHAKEGLAFERSIQAAREAGLLPARLRLALDSSPVRGRGAVKDTFNLLSDVIAAVIREVARRQKKPPQTVGAEAGLARHIEAPSVKGSEIVDWNDQASVGSFLARLLEDCDKAVALAKASGYAGEEVALLEKVIANDVERCDDGMLRIRQGVAPGRTVSVHDRESQHGHKSTGTGYTGHKAHVAVETGSGVVTAVTVTAPSDSEGSQVRPLIGMTTATTCCEIEQAVGDCAYSTQPAQAEAAAEQIELVTKMPAPPKGKFGPGDFTVSEDGQIASCPAGHGSWKVGRSKNGLAHVWNAELCAACPLRPRCTTAKQRTLMMRPGFHERRGRERFARSPQGRALLRSRIAVEHAIGRLKNLGAGAARYCGRAKTRAQWLWTAAVANLMLAWMGASRCPA